MVNYIVRIGYKEFEFINGTTAMTFAEMALTSSAEDDVDVSVILKPVPEPEKVEVEDDDF